MGLSTINTILNTAPLILQGATRLIELIKDRGKEENPENTPDTLEGIRDEVERLNERLDVNDQSNVEQIKLIEELAKQNASIATQLKKTVTHLNRITVVCFLALIIAIASLAIVLKSA